MLQNFTFIAIDTVSKGIVELNTRTETVTWASSVAYGRVLNSTLILAQKLQIVARSQIAVWYCHRSCSKQKPDLKR